MGISNPFAYRRSRLVYFQPKRAACAEQRERKREGERWKKRPKAAPQHEICARQTPFSHFPRGSPDQPTSRQSRRGKSSHFCLNKNTKDHKFILPENYCEIVCTIIERRT